MEASVTRQPDLNYSDWSLVIELLERHAAALPVEIRHTSTRRMRDDLRVRLAAVEAIIAKITAAMPHPAETASAASS
jgi:hypothetical protein